MKYLHFEIGGVNFSHYINYEKHPANWTSNYNVVFPLTKYFNNVTFDLRLKTFNGTVNFPAEKGMFIESMEYLFTFNDDMKTVKTCNVKTLRTSGAVFLEKFPREGHNADDF